MKDEKPCGKRKEDKDSWGVSSVREEAIWDPSLVEPWDDSSPSCYRTAVT